MHTNYFKVGQKVKYRKGRTGAAPGAYADRAHTGFVFTVKCIGYGGERAFLFDRKNPEGVDGETCPCGKHTWTEGLDDIEIISSNSINMTLSEKFAVAFKGEPEKSFIKAGIMNTDESLTEEGQALFLAFLLKEHGTKFKTDIVDPILAEEANK